MVAMLKEKYEKNKSEKYYYICDCDVYHQYNIVWNNTFMLSLDICVQFNNNLNSIRKMHNNSYVSTDGIDISYFISIAM